MEITGIKAFKIDIHNSVVAEINQDNYNTDFETYLQGLIEIIISGSSGRNFKFERDTTEVRAQINNIALGGNFQNISIAIANRLLGCEIAAQARIDRLDVEIQKGILFQALVKENEHRKFVICKSDHNDYLEEISLKNTSGLPLKKRVFKAFVCTIYPDHTIDNVLVYDTNASLSAYWWKEFLELTHVYSDEDNTETAFEAIDKGVFTKMKKEHPQDYIYLRNSTIRYFRATDKFDITEFLDAAIGDYTPYDPKLNIGQLKDTIRSLPSKNRKKFDSQFTIVKSKITARFSDTIKLTDQIDLRLKEDIPHIEKIITAEIGEDGTKYVKIQSESGYRYFNDRKQQN